MAAFWDEDKGTPTNEVGSYSTGLRAQYLELDRPESEPLLSFCRDTCESQFPHL